MQWIKNDHDRKSRSKERVEKRVWPQGFEEEEEEDEKTLLTYDTKPTSVLSWRLELR